MYSGTGHCTLLWSWYDPALKRFFGPPDGFRNEHARRLFEAALRIAPDGTRWSFDNPANYKCLFCSGTISVPMLQTVSYLVYPNSVITDRNNKLELANQLIESPG